MNRSKLEEVMCFHVQTNFPMLASTELFFFFLVLLKVDSGCDKGCGSGGLKTMVSIQYSSPHQFSEKPARLLLNIRWQLNAGHKH